MARSPITNRQTYLIQVLLLTCCVERVFSLMCREIERKFGRIGWIGTKAQTADRTHIVASPYVFAIPICHYSPEAEFFDWHRESPHRFQRHHREDQFKV